MPRLVSGLYRQTLFSGNQAASGHSGGAVENSGTLTVKGCTFYGNSAAVYGGAIYNVAGTLTLTGNLFYGNTATQSSPVVYLSNGTVTSGGGNVVDVALGTGAAQSGFTAAAGDVTINAMPVSPVSFRLLSGSGAANVITTLPAGYPTVDFYGSAIPAANAAAGAVQSMSSSNGHYLDLSVNNTVRGSVTVSPQPDAEGLYPSTVTLTATAAEGYSLWYWEKDGVKAGNTNPLPLTLTAHTTIQAVFANLVMVTNFTDGAGSATTPGTLRYALTNAQNGDAIVLDGVTPGSTTITLTSVLPEVQRDITIEGNGAILTRSFSASTDSRLLSIQSGKTVSISRIHFKDGRVTSDNGGAIRNNGNLTLESCVFSGNQTTGYGGALYNYAGTLTVRGSTFYGNSSVWYGAAIYVMSNTVTVTLTGNLFYGNIYTTTGGSSVMYTYPNYFYGTVSSGGYNVVDVPLGTGAMQSGFTAAAGDVTISTIPVSPVSFRLLSGSGAANVITALPAGYPTVDFYGNAIPAANAAAGAVQGSAASGYYLGFSANSATNGSVTASTDPDADGIYSSAVTLTATPLADRQFRYWLQDGINIGNTNPLPLTLTAHTTVQAVFGRTVMVTDFNDTPGSAGSVTLRYALANLAYDDIIVLDGVTPGSTTITLTSALPPVQTNFTIQGNGVILTRTGSWATVNNDSSLLRINSGTVTINRIHFKDGRAAVGGALDNRGHLTLESCIFSGNQGGSTGGAIYSQEALTVRGCTFYGNSCNTVYGGAIHGGANDLITGSLFYGNTASGSPSAVFQGFYNIMIFSGGYNVVDVAFGTGDTQSGFAAATGDTTLSALGISGAPLNTSTFVPVAGLRSLVPSTAVAGFPATDFYGETRTWPGAPGGGKVGADHRERVRRSNRDFRQNFVPSPVPLRDKTPDVEEMPVLFPDGSRHEFRVPAFKVLERSGCI